MVTFKIVGSDQNHQNAIGNYVIAWEDLTTGQGADWDYQDAVIEVTQAAPIPEPASLVVWSVIGAATGLGALRRRRARWSKENRQAIVEVIQSGRRG
jgi:hypothetical protein